MNDTSWDAFFKFESDNKLFDYRDKDGLPTWDLVRHYVYSRTLDFHHTGSENDYGFAKRMVTKIKIVPLFLKWLFSSHKDYFVFMTSRNMIEGKLTDLNLKSPIDILGLNNCFLVESFANPFDNRFAYPCNPSPSIADAFRFIIRKGYDYSSIIRVIKNHYPGIKLEPNIMNEVYRKFKAQYIFYHWLFKRRNFQSIFLTQNNFQKGMFKAAHDLHIPVYEMQHGYVSRAHMAYSYPEHYEGLANKIYNADVVFSMAPFWFRGVYNPVSRFIPIGNNYQAPDIKRHKIEQRSFVVVSANVYGESLKELVMIFLANPATMDFHFYFKLHPNQFFQYEEYCNYFKDVSQVDVISNQKNMQKLLETAESIILIQSTAAYEALYAGVKVFVYKRFSWEMNEDIADQKGVYFFDNAEELLSKYEESRDIEMKPDDKYFSKFDIKSFLKTIKE